MSLIAFEGIDGTGKSTQAALLEKRINDNAPGKAIRIAEPTKSPHGMKIREAMMNAKERLPFDEELDLFIQDRKYNVEHNIKPALAASKVVILDRYYFSTAAYQGTRGKMSWQQIIDINEQFAPKPAILLVFFLPVDEALKRIDKDAKDAKRESRSYMEKKDTLEKVQAAFQQIHDSKKYNSHAIDAARPVEHLQELIWNIYQDHVRKQRA
ncbi:MAG: dTMP kinase [Candidatus Sigynarchaeota archaeon]